jgi:hypothetical protein
MEQVCMDTQHDVSGDGTENFLSTEVPVYASLEAMLMAAGSLHDFIDMADAALGTLHSM